MTTMHEDENFADDLLVKYLLNEADANERIRAEKWINASPDQQKYYDQLKQAWEKSSILRTTSPSADEAWERFRQQTQHLEEPAKPVIFSIKKVLSAAAILLVIITGVWMWQQNNSTSNLVTVSSGTKVITDTLTDKTIVTMNKDSRLSYSPKFSKRERKVHLQGEAFFNVSKQNNKPFVVQVNNITITVLGTSFNVNGAHGTTEIIVKSGAVKVSNGKNSVQLKANEKVTATGKYNRLEKENINNQLYNYYLTDKFICNRTPLNALIPVLNEAYGVHIKTENPQIGHLLITSTFTRSQPLDTILDIITQTFSPVTYSKEGDQIILK